MQWSFWGGCYYWISVLFEVKDVERWLRRICGLQRFSKAIQGAAFTKASRTWDWESRLSEMRKGGLDASAGYMM